MMSLPLVITTALVLVTVAMLRGQGAASADMPPSPTPAPPLAGALAPLTGVLTPPAPPAPTPPAPAAIPQAPPPVTVGTGPCAGAPLWGKVIVISLAAQQLAACQDGAAVQTTPVTTGRPALPTPPGAYSVLRKISPWVMRSPWPRGSKYWYAPSRVQYTLWFLDPGYAIHDAPWRTAYGLGTDAQGSHGCVNVPAQAMPALYRWADVGVPVLVA